MRLNGSLQCGGRLTQRSMNSVHGLATSSQPSHLRHVTGHVTAQRSLSTLTKQHRQLVESMMRLLEIDGLDLSKHPHTNHVSILSYSQFNVYVIRAGARELEAPPPRASKRPLLSGPQKVPSPHPRPFPEDSQLYLGPQIQL